MFAIFSGKNDGVQPLEMKTYKAKKGRLMQGILLVLLVFPLAYGLLTAKPMKEKLRRIIPLTTPALLMIWPYLDTRYWIRGHSFYYKSGFIKGEIDISSVRTILKGKTRWVGVKPALATGGLIVKYNRYDDVYIAPEDSDALIVDLLTINPAIQVIPPG
ncbi:PH domain-containing protein [Cyclobacterium lianum]|uniref:PH domain-containing protein n=1 Tax=Cyclobacterium lianum TaxID=388280 RepID=A0A1M7QUY9_9BACT|nr:PH domain-containing protein [Cyclobacterium lianum]SHN35414.1 PH domain-containing protein [Cyclobacterium lianum]